MSVRDAASFTLDLFVIFALGLVYVAGLTAKTIAAYTVRCWETLRASVGLNVPDSAHER